MKITVLVATYKRPRFLEMCLESLAGQKRLPDEIVVVVRPEDTETLAVLSEQDENRRIRLALVKEPGIVAAENRGLREASGDVVCLMDDDAEAFPDWLERIESHYQDPGVGAVGGPSIPFVDGKPVHMTVEGRCLEKTWYGRHIGHADRIPSSIRDVHVLRGCNMSFRRELVGGFDTRLVRYWSRFEDDAILPIHRAGHRVIYDPDIRVHHHIAPVKEGETRAQDPTAVFGNQHNNTYVILKHGNPFGNAAFLVFTFVIGDRYNPGLVLSLSRGLLRAKLRESLTALTWGMRGKLAGIRTWYAWRKEGPVGESLGSANLK